MQLHNHILSKIAASLLLCSLAAHAGAAGTVVLNSYGADIDKLEGWPTPLVQGQDIAVSFSLGSATSIQSLLTSIDGAGGVTVGVLVRNGALPSGNSWLYSTHLTDPFVNTLVTPTGWSLAAGNYWLVAVADAGFSGQWQSGTDTPNGSWAYTTALGVWTNVDSPFTGMPAARITVSAVPEPSTYGLMFAGGLLLAAAVRRKSNAQG